MRRFVTLFILAPLAIVVVVLSVANRTRVDFSLDPFGFAPSLSLTAPLFFFLFAALAVGILLGGVATWIGQGKWRRAARAERANAARLRKDVEQLRQQADPSVTALTGPHRDAA
jgi:uncharacterized integral membrane protein